MKRILTILFSTILLASATQVAHAQDPQLSQFYASPLLISPAFAGINNTSKIHFIHRNQWPNLSANYQYSAISAELALPENNAGLGLVLSNDVQFSNLRTTTLAGQYAYHLTVSEDQFVSFGLQAAYVNKGLDLSNLIWSNQMLDVLTGNRGATIAPDPIISNLIPNKHYIDLGVGTMINRGNSWLGLSVDHLNKPDKSLFQNTGIPNFLPMKYSLQLGTKIMLEDPYYSTGTVENMKNEKSFSPVLHFKKQGDYEQMDLGAYFTYSPLTLGVWYRGLPYKKDIQNKFGSSESIVLLLGYHKDNFSVGYSYDTTISSLGPSSGGAHELSLSYTFDFFGDAKKALRNKLFQRGYVCPRL
ncbi:type IX secretion system membrane protein PorP/SprF [Sandaracinomonas limnophila]|uniref:Type IX secretion system membrane protein PorP/SprF n=1 Tax=Sandaracinomonas limnophila TaxID=1862386 RepID=A0A437PS54_9BACT|nr:type IX secretion system membrane protein PorP/SprF [Sandaracinomonas limnophila]RVU25072.1 type IX secretion system membrane protein PorP/SprF [Sandaracinomonas limnophila]